MKVTGIKKTRTVNIDTMNDVSDRLLPGEITEAMCQLDRIITGDPLLAHHGPLRTALYELQTVMSEARHLRHHLAYHLDQGSDAEVRS